MVTAGSGITPVIGMLRNLFPSTDEGVLRPARSADHDIVVVHVAPSHPDSIFIRDLEALDAAGAIRLVARYDDEHGVLDVDDLAALVPDLAERTTLACGPAGLLDALGAHHEAAGLTLTTEQFRTARVEPGDGGTVTFTSGTTLELDGATPILDAAEEAGDAHAERLPDGHLHGLRPPAARGQRPRPAQRRHHHRRARRDRRHQGADLHQRRRRPLPHRPLTQTSPDTPRRST